MDILCGMSYSDALEHAFINGFKIRIVKVNDVYLGVTMEYNPKRVNVELKMDHAYDTSQSLLTLLNEKPNYIEKINGFY